MGYPDMNAIRLSRGDRVFQWVNCALFALLLFVIAYPTYYVVIASISDPTFVSLGQLSFWPKGFTLSGYERVFSTDTVGVAYMNSIVYTALGTGFSLVLSTLFAFPLSMREFGIRKGVTWLLLGVAYFNAGMIPTFVMMSQYGLVGKPLAVILLKAMPLWNIIILRTFFKTTIPRELYESVRVDGCGDFKYFLHIVLPLSKPILVVFVLFNAVSRWNDYMTPLIYLHKQNDMPLQILLRNILLQLEMTSADYMAGIEDISQRMKMAYSMQYTLIVVGSLPLMVAYPFLQKYFVKGIMIGSVKG